jgi:two-component system response regulator
MNTGTILLVEDNEDDADLTILAFKRANIMNEVVVATDGAIALDMLFGAGAFSGSGAESPSLLILDLNLPKVSGLEVLRRVRAEERTRFTPAVMLTTSVEDQDVIKSYAAGANAYVRKPVAFEEFLAETARLGQFWLQTNVSAPADPAVPR